MRTIGNEMKYLQQVIDSQFRSSMNGYWTRKAEEAFAREYDQKYAVAFCNGTATLHACLSCIPKGSYVAVPPLTMASTALAVVHAGCYPVWVDVNKDDWTMDPDKLEEACKNYFIQAVIVVSLYGVEPNMPRIKEICRKYRALLIEDAAQDIGTQCMADITSFSFQASKHLTCGEGGMILTDSESHATKIRQFGSLGYPLDPNKPRITKSDIQTPDYMRHDTLGYNFRMSDLQAAVILAQLERKEELLEHRMKSFKAYQSVNSDLLKPQSYYRTSAWAWAVEVKADWHKLKEKLAELHADPPYAAWAVNYKEKALSVYQHTECPTAEKLQPRIMAFPTNLFDDERRQWNARCLKLALEGL